MFRYVALILLAAVVAVSAARAQEMRTVTLLSNDRAKIDTTVVAVKDIGAHLASSSQSKRLIVVVRNCPKVSADAVQAVLKELQTKNYIVTLDFNPPDPRLCAG